MITSCLDAYISRYGDFCANDNNDNDDNNDTTDYFTPCACARGNARGIIIADRRPSKASELKFFFLLGLQIPRHLDIALALLLEVCVCTFKVVKSSSGTGSVDTAYHKSGISFQMKWAAWIGVYCSLIYMANSKAAHDKKQMLSLLM